ncbi:unnamed protein product [Rotaria magnacalcarata]|uniref:SAM domain-containing protein n=1 Tax=Rotaria magnacalcarata TaxID=392030 RepID=A0A816Y5J2_9BILA|nr:unnamed protein product [Rotaria magnacalcarata]CAF2197692.1 unnamed protein product [Rotaria magnacalcarata]
MLTLSEKVHDQNHRIQQQLDGWTLFEQIYAAVELSKKLHLRYRYFLAQFLSYSNNQQNSDDMLRHTVDQANAPIILACLLSDPLDKIISTLQLYLPLVSLTATDEKLPESYRNVLIYLDSKLNNPSNFSCSQQQLIGVCQQIQFFIQTNPRLQKFQVDIPQLNALVSSAAIISKGNTEEKSLSSSPLMPIHHQPLQHFPSIRLYQQTSPPPPLLNFASEGSHTSSSSQQSMRHAANDSGVDLTEPNMINSVQNNLALISGQDNHIFTGKTTSSPTPEQTISNHSQLTPLSAAVSSPSQSIGSYYSELRHQSSNYQPQMKSTLTISDEDEEIPQTQHNFTKNFMQTIPNSIDNFHLDPQTPDNRNRLRQFCSLRNRNTKPYPNASRNSNELVSPYLCVDGNSGSVPNKFLQPNSGMRDVPKWLKTLRLHKYAFFFSQMTYDQMMNLTFDQLKEAKITDGACTKILLNIKKLKERQSLLQQCIIDIDNGQIDIKTVLQLLNEFMLTPIHVKQTEKSNDDIDDEDLPKLIMQVLEKVYQQLTCSNSSTNILSEMCNNLVGLFDRCYKHEAFSPDQRHALLHWRGPLCNKLQTSGKVDYKSMQSSSSSLNRRVQLRPQTSMGNVNTTPLTRPIVRNIKSTVSYYSNYNSNSVPLSRQYIFDMSNQNGTNNQQDSTLNRRPVKSPTFLFTTNTDSNEDSTGLTDHLSVTSTPSLQERLINHQSAQFITERTGNGTGNFRPAFSCGKSSTQNNNGAYLATNQHQLLTRKKSIGLYGDTNLDDKTKLCKTYSDPSKIRFYNPIPTGNIQSTTHSQLSPQQTPYRVTSTPYSSQQYLVHSQMNNESSIQHKFSDTSSPIYYGNDNNNSTQASSSSSSSSSSNDSHSQNLAHEYHQQHNTAEFETLCRQITESAINDDPKDISIDHKNDSSNIQIIQSPSNNSADTE